MPCRYDDFGESDRQKQAELDKLTRMLCEVLIFTKDYVSIKFSKETEDWWETHKKLDDARKAEKAKEKIRALIKKNALAKLTKEEKRELGLS